MRFSVKNRILLSSLVVMYLFPFLLDGQEILTAENFFDQISAKYGEVQDYVAQVTITIEREVMEGTLYYKIPNRLRIDYTNPAEQVLVTDGNRLVVYIPQYRVVMAQTLKRRSAAAIASMASRQGLILLKRNYSIAYLSSPAPVPLDDRTKEPVTKLKLTWRSSDEGFRELILSINAEGYIRRIEGITVGYQRIVFDFRNLRINQNIPDSRFRYDPPASANVIENFLFDPEN
ncbi:MAG: outer membrane lipoprotein carrier protein LolA [Spirochaetales bacterium]